MQKHVMGIFWRACVVLTVMAFTAIAANAQLLNGSFETPGTNFVYPADSLGVIITNTLADGWTPLELGFRTATNSPSSGTYTEGDFGHTFPGIDSSGSTNTAHTGSFAARMFGPFPNVCCAASGVSQVITNSISQAVSNNQIWVLSGYGLNWSGDPMYNESGAGVGPDVNRGLIQIEFLDATGANILGTFDGPGIGTNATLDTWISCSVTGTAPAGTAQVRFYMKHVGVFGASGSVFFDDLSITNIGVAPPPPPIVTNQFQTAIHTGNQLCWPTVADSSYQPQFSEDNSNWTSFGALVPGDGTTNCVFGFKHNFYRVLRLQ